MKNLELTNETEVKEEGQLGDMKITVGDDGDFENATFYVIDDYDALDSNEIDVEPEGNEIFIKKYMERCNVSLSTAIQDICKDYNIELFTIKLDDNYYFSFDNSKFSEAIMTSVSELDIDITELYKEVKDTDLWITIEEEIVRECVQDGISFYRLEDGYAQGDATDAEVIDRAKSIKCKVEDLYTELDDMHEKNIEDALIAHYGSKENAIIELLKYA